jgi:thioredoxin 1
MFRQASFLFSHSIFLECIMAKAGEVTDNDFEKEVLQSDLPVLVDFWATWCGPCKAVGPIVDELSEVYAGKAKILKVNTDANPRTPSQYNVRSIPTLILFKGGKIVDQHVGAATRATIEGLLKKGL